MVSNEINCCSNMYVSKNQTPVCEFQTQCSSFKRLVKNGYRKDDLMHCSSYQHFGRRGGLTTDENLGSNKFISAYRANTCFCSQVSYWTGPVVEGDLIEELERNGFSHVLTPTNGTYCHLHDFVVEKLNHARHKEMGFCLSYDEMLAVVLYTNTGVYADLRCDEMLYSTQNFLTLDSQATEWKTQKWPVFGYTLERAIKQLYRSNNKSRPKVVYHGLHNVYIDRDPINTSYSQRVCYGTFVSASCDKDVALGFMCGVGTLMQIDVTSMFGADVSWISKFPLELEYLISRYPEFYLRTSYYDEKNGCTVYEVSASDSCHKQEDGENAGLEEP